jgi:hypothetical protein
MKHIPSFNEFITEAYKQVGPLVKIAGKYEVIIGGNKENITVAGFERQNDDSDSLYLMDSDKLKPIIGSLIVKNSDMFKLEKGTTVKAITSKGNQDVKIKRIGNL